MSDEKFLEIFGDYLCECAYGPNFDCMEAICGCDECNKIWLSLEHKENF